ncbi:MAG TPA: hypothetical protein VF742_13940, partial [Terracidiphilus sp.]
MALTVKLKSLTGKGSPLSLLLRVVLICVAIGALVVLTVGASVYFKYGSIVDARLQQPLFKNTAKIYA